MLKKCLLLIIAFLMVFSFTACGGQEKPAKSTTPAKEKASEFRVTDLTVNPSEVKPEEPVSITAKVTNIGEKSGEYDVELFVDGSVEETESVTLAGGDEGTVSFKVKREEPRTYTIRIANLSQTFKVEAPSGAAKISHELVRAGDFAIALADMKREEETTILDFAVTKVEDTGLGPQSVRVTLMDDHGNEYSGDFDIDLEGASDYVINALPKGFTYVESMPLSMPRAAPIRHIKLGESLKAFEEVRFVKPQFLNHFGDLALEKGESVKVGNWLRFSVKGVDVVNNRVALEIETQNEEYNPVQSKIRIGVQNKDGGISWGEAFSQTTPGLSKSSRLVELPVSAWKADTALLRKPLLLEYSSESERIHKVYTIAEFPSVELKWSFESGGCCPAIASDGTVYVVSREGPLYALNPDGTLKWSFEAGAGIHHNAPPTIASDETIYVGAGKVLYALNPDGTLKWSFKTGYGIGDSSPAIARDGTIYVGADKTYALNPDGTPKWSFRTGYVDTSPAIASDGTVYVGSDQGIYALNPDGTLKWSFETRLQIDSSPSIAPDGTIYAGSHSGKLYALSPDGTLKWSFRGGFHIRSSPAIASDGTVYVGAQDEYGENSKIHALNPDGSLKWSFEIRGYVRSSPAIASDGTIYVGAEVDYRSKTYALNSDGGLKWSCGYSSRIPAIIPDGTIYLGAHALGENNGGLANSPWPMFQHDPQHTGRQSAAVIPETKEEPAQTKSDLSETLKDLRETMLKKLDSDINVTSAAFTDVKDYWRSKRWADIFTAPLRIVEDTLDVLAEARDLESLGKNADAALQNSEGTLKVLSTMLMLQDLQKVGEKLQYGLDGPTYRSSVESMLEAADVTTEPPTEFSRKDYKNVIENHLYALPKADPQGPLVIPRKSTTTERENVDFVNGAFRVRSSIDQIFDELIAEVEQEELPQDFPVEDVIAQIEEVTKQVNKSRSWGTELEYKTAFQDHVQVKLGAVGCLYTAFGEVAGMVDKQLEIKEHVQVARVVEAVGNAAFLYTVTYDIPGKEAIKVTQKAITLGDVVLEGHKNSFSSNPEEKFYMLPQEMLISLPTELSNLWMIAEDTDQYLRQLLK